MRQAIRPKRQIAYIALSAAVTTLPAAAQDAASEEPEELETVVVTGEKLNRSIKDTASSVEVTTADDLENKADIPTLREAIKNAPNVTYATGVGQAPTIRGQNTGGPNAGAFAFLGGTVPRIQISADGRTLQYYEFVTGLSSIWDVESIEVFRGPQTSAQGANANAGAIVINTKDPTYTPEGQAQLMIGSHAAKRASVAASGPFSEDFAGRLALDYYERDTIVDYANPKFTAGETKQDLQSYNGRAKLLWNPSHLPRLEAKLTLTYSGSATPQYEAVGKPFKDRKSQVGSWPSVETQSQGSVFDVSYALSDTVTLYNRMQYTETDVDRKTQPLTLARATVDRYNSSNETRLTFGQSRDTISGVAGLFYSYNRTRDTLDQSLLLETFFKPVYGATSALSSFKDTKQNLGVYTDISYRLTDRWTLNGGLRYQTDSIRREGVYEAYVKSVDYDETFNDLLAKVSVAYDVTPDLRLGATVNKGYNPGGITFDLGRAQWIPFAEETIWNYELYTRASMLNGKLNLNANVFYMDMVNAQRFVSYIVGRDRQFFTVNADKAYSQGAEFAVDYQVASTVKAKFGAGFLNTKITKFTNPVGDFKDKEFAKSPSYTANLGVDWNVTRAFKTGIGVKTTDGYYSDDANSDAFKVDGFTVANARVSYLVSDQVELLGFINNIFDDRSPTYLQSSNAPATRGQTEASIVTPREFIAGVRMSF